MHVHGIAEIADDAFGAHPARFNFVRVAPFAMQNLLVANGHAAAANPVLAVARVNMVEIGQVGKASGIGYLSEYQIGCGRNPELDRLGF